MAVVKPPMLLVLLLLSGCSSIGKINWFDQSVIADSTTTFVGLEYAGARELNPLLGQHPVKAALGGAALSYGFRYLARSWFDRPGCVQVMHSISAAKLGAAVNNLLVIAKAGGVLPVVAGIGAAIWVWNSEPDQTVCDRI